MSGLKWSAAAFLDSRRIAVTGVSRTAEGHGSNVVYTRLRERGYDVVAVNPNATEVEGDRCYPDLASIPGGVDAVVIGTRPEHAEATVRQCAELGIDKVSMHRSVGKGSVSQEAAELGRRAGIDVIAGGCPLMFDPVSDPGHKVMRAVCTLTGACPGGTARRRPPPADRAQTPPGGRCRREASAVLGVPPRRPARSGAT